MYPVHRARDLEGPWPAGRERDVPALQWKNDEFREHYPEQSNVETTFHVLEPKFGDSVNAKNERAQFNETLREIPCHHVVMVIHEILESEIDPSFLSADLETASELI